LKREIIDEEEFTMFDRNHYWILWLHILFLLFFVVVGTSTLFAQCLPIKGRSALPGEDCQTDLVNGWESQEKWVWSQLCRGKVADFNTAEGYWR
jgi:hypothetical protein